MQDKTKLRKPLIQKGPLKTFLFFLGFSTMVWFFVQFSKEYSEIVEFPIAYANVPKDKIFFNDSPQILNLRLQDNGINIAFRKIFPKKLIIDISEAREEEGVLIYDLEQHKPSILSQLNIDFEDVNFLQEGIRIKFEQRTVKLVEVVPDIDLGFSVGYSALDKIEIDPDSVTVSGPQNIIDTLQQVRTENLKLRNISQDMEGTVKLDKSNLGKLNFYQDEIHYSLRTDKFTEGKVQIPVELINIPKNMNVVIFPKDVTVYYQVSLSEFDKIKSEGFKVVADFKKAQDGNGFLIAQIVKQPKLVNNLRLNEQKIQYVIKR